MAAERPYRSGSERTENRAPYYAALQEADAQLAATGQFNVQALAEYLADLLEAQLREDDV